LKNFSNPQLHAFYDLWVPHQYNRTWLVAKRLSWQKVELFWKFYLGVFLSIPLIAFPCILRDRRVRLLLIQFAVCSVGLFAAVWFLPHYAAPISVVFFALLMQCLRHLRQWKFRGRPVGIGLSRLVVTFSLLTIFMSFGRIVANPYASPYFDEWQPHNWVRAKIIENLQNTPGDHLILVRYAQKHNIHAEWVYNVADIDHAKVIWAREIPGMDLTPLLTYYSNRKVWYVEPDQSNPTLYPYPVGSTTDGPSRVGRDVASDRN